MMSGIESVHAVERSGSKPGKGWPATLFLMAIVLAYIMAAVPQPAWRSGSSQECR